MKLLTEIVIAFLFCGCAQLSEKPQNANDTYEAAFVQHAQAIGVITDYLHALQERGILPTAQQLEDTKGK